MADTTNLSKFLENVADAIRTKKETTEKIPAESFDSEILSIEAGTDTSDATATAQDILLGKTAYIKDGKVTGMLKGARYYATEEEMYADTTVEPVTYGLIYQEIEQGWTPENGSGYMKFPDVVVLPEALTTTLRARLFGEAPDSEYGYVDIDMYLSSSGGQIMSWSGGKDFNLYYNTEDGMTFTRQGPAEVDWGIITAWENTEGDWDATWGYFVKTITGEQGGLYKYDYATQVDGYYGYNPISGTHSEQSFIFPKGYYGRDRGGHPIIIYPQEWEYNAVKRGNVLKKWYEYDPNGNTGYGSPTAPIGILEQDGKYYYCCAKYNSSSSLNTITKRTLVVNEDGTVTKTESGTSLTLLATGSNHNYYRGPEITANDWLIAQVYYNELNLYTFSGTSFTEYKAVKMENASVPMYTMTKNQFTLMKSNELLPGVVAFGKEDVVVGDGSIYDNLDMYSVPFDKIPTDVFRENVYGEHYRMICGGNLQSKPKNSLQKVEENVTIYSGPISDFNHEKVAELFKQAFPQVDFDALDISVGPHPSILHDGTISVYRYVPDTATDYVIIIDTNDWTVTDSYVIPHTGGVVYFGKDYGYFQSTSGLNVTITQTNRAGTSKTLTASYPSNTSYISSFGNMYWSYEPVKGVLLTTDYSRPCLAIANFNLNSMKILNYENKSTTTNNGKTDFKVAISGDYLLISENKLSSSTLTIYNVIYNMTTGSVSTNTYTIPNVSKYINTGSGGIQYYAQTNSANPGLIYRYVVLTSGEIKIIKTTVNNTGTVNNVLMTISLPYASISLNMSSRMFFNNEYMILSGTFDSVQKQLVVRLSDGSVVNELPSTVGDRYVGEPASTAYIILISDETALNHPYSLLAATGDRYLGKCGGIGFIVISDEIGSTIAEPELLKPDYSDTITPEDYDTALETAQNILGEEV